MSTDADLDTSLRIPFDTAKVTITLWGFLSIEFLPVITFGVKGNLNFEGDFAATGSFDAFKKIGGGYNDESGEGKWVDLSDSSWTYAPLQVSNSITSGSVSAAISAKFECETTLSVSVVGALNLGVTASVFIKASAKQS